MFSAATSDQGSGPAAQVRSAVHTATTNAAAAHHAVIARAAKVPHISEPSTFLGYPDVTSFLQAWLPIIFMGLLVVSVFMLMRFMPKTKPVEIKPESALPIGWGDIAGCDEAKDELREVVE